MNNRDLTALLVKISGLVIMTWSVVNVPGYVGFYFSVKNEPTVIVFLVTLVPFLIPFLAGFAIWRFPATLTNAVIGKGEPDKVGGPAITQIEQVAISVLGLFLLFHAISDMTTYLSFWYRMVQMNGSSGAPDPTLSSRMLATCLELVMSVWLVFGARGIQRVISRIRGRGEDA